MRYFVTGTDTGCGKTYVTSLWLREWNAAGVPAVGFKPVCCGDRGDVEALRQAGAAGPDADLINPVYYRQPQAPLAAGWLENRPFDAGSIRRAWNHLSGRWEHILVEGAGGWEVPVTERETMANVAASLGLPVVVVVNNRLGALNQVLLTVRSIRAHGLECAGIILNQPEDERDSASISNPAVLRAVLPEIPLAEIMHGEMSLPPDEFPPFTLPFPPATAAGHMP